MYQGLTNEDYLEKEEDLNKLEIKNYFKMKTTSKGYLKN